VGIVNSKFNLLIVKKVTPKLKALTFEKLKALTFENLKRLLLKALTF
jgi:hypothetical protein